ncbi:MAG: MFS transporter [Cyclobacteriaceae bacterium]|nr:MAG: MFS transporter [Cyclobacteriaceae bacterium]
MPHMNTRSRKGIVILVLIIAGETVFLLPFVVARIFRPTFLDVFELTNLQLGTAFALYGLVAMVSYLLGGPLADRYSGRRLMAAALIATSLGGLLFASVPSLQILTWLYAFWGLTTILLFWAALIRATREWGGIDQQGKAYGLLDGGRGLFAALVASFSVWIFSLLLPEQVLEATMAQRTAALKQIILIYTFLVLVVSGLVWWFIPETNATTVKSSPKVNFAGIKYLMTKPAIWLQAIIVVCAYAGYKTTDDFSLYARDAFGYNEVEAAKIGTISFWMRPLAAIAAGYLADRFSASRLITISFSLVLLGSLCLGTGMLKPNTYWFLLIAISATSAGIYAVRGVYFALYQEARIPLAITGSAVGLVSLIGFTPDIFMGPLMGYLIDRSPGAVGHQQVFLVLAGLAVVGLAAVTAFRFSDSSKTH